MTTPSSREYPKTYLEFTGKSQPNAPARRYWIQDAPEEFFDEIVHHLNEGFAKDEPISKYMKGYTDKISMAEVRVFQYQMLREKRSLACFTKTERGETKLAGCNALTLETKETEDDDDFKPKGWFLPFMVDIFDYLHSQRSIFDAFGVEAYLSAQGLFVLPEYRGEGLGEQLLRARIPLCKSLGIKVTSTIFTSTLSQKAAYRAGYEDFYSIDYEDLFKVKPEFYIPGIQEHTQSIKILYKLIE